MYKRMLLQQEREKKQLQEALKEQQERANRKEKNLKAPKSNPSAGEPGTLKGFIVQLKTYFWFIREQFSSEAERVLISMSFLEGPPLGWVQPLAEDFQNNSGGTIFEHSLTKGVFTSLEAFLNQLTVAFGDKDKGWNNQEAIRRLRENP